MINDVFLAGYFYCPYIPLQYSKERTKTEYRAGRKEYLMSCPSYPYTCTGECHTKEFELEVEEFLRKEFGEI